MKKVLFSTATAFFILASSSCNLLTTDESLVEGSMRAVGVQQGVLRSGVQLKDTDGNTLFGNGGCMLQVVNHARNTDGSIDYSTISSVGEYVLWGHREGTGWNYSYASILIAYGDAPAYGTTATSSYWGTSSPCVIVADSTDLINWTAVRCRVLAKQTDGTVLASRHMWAPEVVKINKYDSYTEDDAYDYGVIWSGNFSADGIEDGSPEDYINRTYISYTNDFDTFSTPVLFFQDDYTGTVVTEIDANVVLWGDKYYMFSKNEADDGKDIALSVSDSLKPLSFTCIMANIFLAIRHNLLV